MRFVINYRKSKLHAMKLNSVWKSPQQNDKKRERGGWGRWWDICKHENILLPWINIWTNRHCPSHFKKNSWIHLTTQNWKDKYFRRNLRTFPYNWQPLGSLLFTTSANSLRVRCRTWEAIARLPSSPPMTDQSHLGVALQDPLPIHTYIGRPPSEVGNWPPA